MLVIFRKFAVTKANVKVISSLLVLLISCLLLAGQVKTNKTAAPLEDSMGGREVSALTVDLASLETTGLSEPEDLTQSHPRMLLFSSYVVQQGDVVGEIAKKFGLSVSTLVSVNNIKNTRALRINSALRIPNQDGIFYTPRKGDTLTIIAEKHKADVSKIKAANELFSDDINPNNSLFIPGASIPWEDEQVVVVAARPQVIVSQKIFDWPVSGRITSYYGYRRSPFARGRSFHDGLDIGVPMGTPIRAAMAGRVESVGYDNTYGNFVIIRHADGYKTLYGHLESYDTRNGAYVDIDTVIGYAVSTGLSTGAHLHFTVYKDGSSINPRTVLK